MVVDYPVRLRNVEKKGTVILHDFVVVAVVVHAGGQREKTQESY